MGRAGVTKEKSAALNAKIQKLYTQGLGSRAIGSALGLNPVVVYKRLRRMGINRTLQEHVTAQGEKLLPSYSLPFSVGPDRERLRQAAIGRAVEWFLLRDYLVSIPVTPARYDLIVESDRGLKRVQIKSTTVQAPSGGWSVGIDRKPYDPALTSNAMGKRKSTPYTSEEIDLFFILTGDSTVYILPVGVVQGQKNLILGQKYTKYVVGA
jgi:hypothetical protein